jgi:hypothetical protein
MSAVHVALTALQSAELRMAASAHNLANLGTERFHPLRAEQSALPDGGVVTRISQAPGPEEVSLAREFVSQIEARTQFLASLRTLAADRETKGSLLDVLA